MPWHIAQALPTPVGCVVSLVDACHVLSNCGLAKSVKPFEDALIGEMQAAVAMATVLLRRLLEGTFLGNVPLFLAVVAEVVAASALKERTLYWSSTMWGQRHPILSHCMHWGIGNVCISDLFQCLYLFHPPLYPIYLHVDCKESAR